MKTINLKIELTDKQAWDLAQFLKRISYSDVQRTANPNRPNEVDDMLDSLSVVERSLNEAGYAPR